MSDTPRTDNQAFGAEVMAHEMVHADFARALERENAQLREQLNELTTRIAHDWDEAMLYRELARLRIENAKLLKDMERIDWMSGNYVESLRDHIDEAMKGVE